MPRLRALRSSAERKAGEEFEASESDARLLCAPDALGGQKATLVDRSMRAAEPETAKQPPSADETIAGKRRYLRRDLRAQN